MVVSYLCVLCKTLQKIYSCLTCSYVLLTDIRTPSRSSWDDEDATPSRAKWEMPSPSRSVYEDMKSERR